MAFTMDSITKAKRNQEFSETGRQTVTVEEAVMSVSKNTGKAMLVVTFRTAGGSRVKEFYLDSPESGFMMFKLQRLLLALNISIPEGIELTLSDLQKLIKKESKVDADLSVNDNGYGQLDYSGQNEGLYKTEQAEIGQTEITPALDTDLATAIDISETIDSF